MILAYLLAITKYEPLWARVVFKDNI